MKMLSHKTSRISARYHHITRFASAFSNQSFTNLFLSALNLGYHFTPQETMMTPRSRKPVLLMSGTNICNLPKMDLAGHASFSDLEEEPEPPISPPPNPITKAKSESNILATPHEKFSTYSKTADTLTTTFQEYLCSRSMQTPIDLSFSSRTDDYDSAEEFPSESKLNESLLYCLDGNVPPSLDNSDSSFRKRLAEDDMDEQPKKFIVEKELVLKPKQYGANGEPIIFETSF